MTGFHDYEQYDGLGLAELVQKKEVKPLELVEESIIRIEKLNPHINAVVHKMYDDAKTKSEKDVANGPFAGVPFLLKDLGAAFEGAPMRQGSRFHIDHIPDHDSELVTRYKMAGLICLGKTNTPEYGLVPFTEPELSGTCNNPWDVKCTSGGSSGGSAAAVATRIVPIAHGNDGGGSIRIPASCCGVFGLKPTRGRTPVGPDREEIWHGCGCDHVLTVSVRDSAAILDATAGPDLGALYFAPSSQRPFLQEVGDDPGALKIAYSSKPFIPAVIHEDCATALDETVILCQGLGHEMTEDSPVIDGEAFAKSFVTMLSGETRADIEEASIISKRKPKYEHFEPATWMLALLGSHIKGADFAAAIHQLHHNARVVGKFFQYYDILMTPTLALPPVLTATFQTRGIQDRAIKILGKLNAGRLLDLLGGIDAIAKEVFAFMPFTTLFNVAGNPAMSVPLYWNDEGLPIGIQFVGRYGDEATLFRLAAQLEKARPWFNRIPPVCADISKESR